MMSLKSLGIDTPDGELAKHNRKSKLREIIRDRSFSDKKMVTLSSGRESSLYFNMKTTMLDNEASLLLAQELLSMIDDDVDFIGGLEMGAVPIVSALCPVAASNGREVRAFFVRKKAKEHGAKKLVEGLMEDESLDGKKVVVVDDVTTTGGSVVSTFDTLKELGADIVKVISVVDREEGAVQLFADHGIPFVSVFKASDFTH